MFWLTLPAAQGSIGLGKLDRFPLFYINNGIGGAVQFTGAAFNANRHIDDGLCIPIRDRIAFTTGGAGSTLNTFAGHNVWHNFFLSYR
jgi:hypothetical protein